MRDKDVISALAERIKSFKDSDRETLTVEEAADELGITLDDGGE